jgi:aspartyl-tRNA(Asn)/glutamyl-tRNA(Gln) amidotransferase subunit A
MSLTRMNISELRGLLETRRISPLDVAREFLAAIEAGNRTINAFIHVDADGLLAAARAMTDDNRISGRPLGGIPLAVKDNICVEGSATTCASRMLEHYRSPYTATVVRKLHAAGALVLGKTNLDEFAMGSSTENSYFGPSRNPWSLERTPGGSSGGSAAAVAAGLAPAALGSDTGGSIRQPAAFCGLVGLRPSYGAVSRYGLVAFASSLDQVGPLTRTVEDARRLFGVIRGPDPRDATTSLRRIPIDLEGPGELVGLRLGIPRDFPPGSLADDVGRNFDELGRRLDSAKVRLVEVALPHLEYALACYYIIASAEASANLARYDGLRYGHNAIRTGSVLDTMSRNRGEGFGEEVQRRILAGTFVLSEGYIDAYYRQAQQVRELIRRDFERAFGDCDLILMPTSPTPAFELGERTDDPLAMYESDGLTVPASLAGLPAVTVPNGLSGEGLPLGVQVIGNRFEEALVFRGALGLERLVDFRARPPVFFPEASDAPL